MTTEHPALAQLSAALRPTLADGPLSWLWQPLLQLLARGAPVTTSELAATTGHTTEDVHHALAQLPDAEYDEHGHLLGYGLTQRRTPHRFTVGDQQLYTWCALDTLIFPALLARPATVESPCHATETPIRVQIEPDRIVNLTPKQAVVSLVTPEQCTSVRSDFCNQVHFFASPEAAQHWLAAHPGATVFPVAEAFALGHQLIRGHLATA